MFVVTGKSKYRKLAVVATKAGMMLMPKSFTLSLREHFMGYVQGIY
jgi:hypothetical protein